MVVRCLALVLTRLDDLTTMWPFARLLLLLLFAAAVANVEFELLTRVLRLTFFLVTVLLALFDDSN